MRLVHTRTLETRLFYDPGTRPPYAALSYTWSPDHPIFSDFAASPTKLLFPLVAAACSAARDWGCEWIWIYSICVDPSSTAEVSEAVNSAFAWFREAATCLAYISDVPPADAEPRGGPGCVVEDVQKLITSSKWFTRAWTLVELLAPPEVRFFDRDWNFRGTRMELSGLISKVTHISEDVLLDRNLIPDVALGKRMSWAAARSTTRVEDTTYSLLGIFGVNMPIIYGEGARAFSRLLGEIIKESQDTSLLIWDPAPSEQNQRPFRGLFASSPAEYSRFVTCPPQWCKPLQFDGEVQATSRGLSIRGKFMPFPRCRNRILLDLGHHDGTPGKRAALVLVRVQDTFVRPASNAVVAISAMMTSRAAPGTIIARRDLDQKTALSLSETLQSVPPAGPGTGVPLRPLAHPTSPPSKRKSIAPRDPTTLPTSPPALSESFILSHGGSSLASRRVPKRGFTSCVAPARGDKRPRRTTLHTFTPNISTMSSASSETADDIADHDVTDEDDDHEDGDGGSTTSEESPSIFEPATREPPPTLEEGHPFLAVLDELCEEAHAAFPAWKSDTTVFLRSDTHFSAAPREPTLFFACHFWKRDPARHRACLRREQLATDADVKGHAWRAHGLPCYCPVCYETFPSLSLRDEHIVRRSCDLRPRPPMEGVSEDQRQRLVRKSPGERADRWFAIWDILFPGEPRPATPFLDGSEEARGVGLVREFWAERGEMIVSSFLRGKGLLSWAMKDEERSLAALYALVLERLVEAEAEGGVVGWEMVAAGASTPVRMDPVKMGAPADQAPLAGPLVGVGTDLCRDGMDEGSCAGQGPM